MASSDHVVIDDDDDNYGAYRGRKVAQQMGRERLLRYVKDLIRIQRMPLPDIIRDHALHHLPAQSLCRFRCVAAAWNRHISCPFFAHTQSHTHRSLSGFFFSATPFGGTSYLPVDPRAHAVPNPSLSFIPQEVVVVAASNGLVACRGSVLSGGDLRYYICNPATAQWTSLPSPLSLHSSNGPVSLVFQPSLLNFAADYHLVCGISRRSGLEVFSSESGVWRTSSVVLPEAASTACWSSVVVAGVAYWCTRGDAFVSYDPNADELGLVKKPETAEQWWRWQLGEMDGTLCCVGVKAGIVEIYISEPGRRSAWGKLRSLDVGGDPCPLVFEGREEAVFLWERGRVVRMEVRSGARRTIGEGMQASCIAGAVPYISSLVSVKEFCVEQGRFTSTLHSSSGKELRALVL